MNTPIFPMRNGEFYVRFWAVFGYRPESRRNLPKHEGNVLMALFRVGETYTLRMRFRWYVDSAVHNSEDIKSVLDLETDPGATLDDLIEQGNALAREMAAEMRAWKTWIIAPESDDREVVVRMLGEQSGSHVGEKGKLS